MKHTKTILKKLIKEYLENARMMQIATVKNDQPWVCTVYFAFDKDFNLYWISQQTRRHSEELRNNKKTAGTIVLHHTPGDSVRGIQFQGTAKELLDKKEAKVALACYAKRYGMPVKRVKEILDGTDGHVAYKITPSLYVLFDEVNFPNDPRQAYKP